MINIIAIYLIGFALLIFRGMSDINWRYALLVLLWPLSYLVAIAIIINKQIKHFG